MLLGMQIDALRLGRLALIPGAASIDLASPSPVESLKN
jgi:hypothetical protein